MSIYTSLNCFVYIFSDGKLGPNDLPRGKYDFRTPRITEKCPYLGSRWKKLIFEYIDDVTISGIWAFLCIFGQYQRYKNS